jgi:hypothetical protein
MERIQKTYQSTQAIQLDTYTLVDGQKRLIEFRGGTYDPRKNGQFNTSDPKVIAALEADIARVGADKCTFKCISTETFVDDELEEATTEPLEPKDIPGVKTVTAAKKWLLEASEQGLVKKGITPSMIKNRTDVLKIAGENKVTFTELPTEG